MAVDFSISGLSGDNLIYNGNYELYRDLKPTFDTTSFGNPSSVSPNTNIYKKSGTTGNTEAFVWKRTNGSWIISVKNVNPDGGAVDYSWVYEHVASGASAKKYPWEVTTWRDAGKKVESAKGTSSVSFTLTVAQTRRSDMVRSVFADVSETLSTTDNTRANRQLNNLDSVGQAVIDNKLNVSVDNLSSGGETVIKGLINQEISKDARKRYGVEHFSASDFSVSKSGETPTLLNVDGFFKNDFVLPSVVGTTVQLNDPTKFPYKQYTGSHIYYGAVQINIPTNESYTHKVTYNSQGDVDLIQVLNGSTVVYEIEDILGGIQNDVAHISSNLVVKSQEFIEPVTVNTRSYDKVFSILVPVKLEFFNNQIRAQISLESKASSGNPEPFQMEHFAGKVFNIDKSFISEHLTQRLKSLENKIDYVSDHVSTDSSKDVSSVFWGSPEHGNSVSTYDGTLTVSSLLGYSPAKEWQIGDSDKNSNNKPNAGNITIGSSDSETFKEGYTAVIRLSKMDDTTPRYARIINIRFNKQYQINITDGSVIAKINITFTNSKTATIAYVSGNTTFGVYQIWQFKEAPSHMPVGEIGLYAVLDNTKTTFTAGSGTPTHSQEDDLYTSWTVGTGVLTSPYRGGSTSLTATDITQIYSDGLTNAHIALNSDQKLSGSNKFLVHPKPNQYYLIQWRTNGTLENEFTIHAGTAFRTDNHSARITNRYWGSNSIVKRINENTFEQTGQEDNKYIGKIWVVSIGNNHIENPAYNTLVIRANDDLPSLNKGLLQDPNKIITDGKGSPQQVLTSTVERLNALNDVDSSVVPSTANAGKYLKVKNDGSEFVLGEVAKPKLPIRIFTQTSGLFFTRKTDGSLPDPVFRSSFTESNRVSGSMSNMNSGWTATVSATITGDSGKGFGSSTLRTTNTDPTKYYQITYNRDLNLNYMVFKTANGVSSLKVSGVTSAGVETTLATKTFSSPSNGEFVHMDTKGGGTKYRSYRFYLVGDGDAQIDNVYFYFTKDSAVTTSPSSYHELKIEVENSKVWSLSDQKTASGGTPPSGKIHIELPASPVKYNLYGAGGGGGGGWNHGQSSSNGADGSSTSITYLSQVAGAFGGYGGRGNDKNTSGRPSRSGLNAITQSIGGYVKLSKGANGGVGASHASNGHMGQIGRNGGFVSFQLDMNHGGVSTFTIGTGGSGGWDTTGYRGANGDTGYIEVEYVGE